MTTPKPIAKVILLIEDDENMIILIEKLVLGLNYKFEFARDGLSGLEKARKLRPNLIILDVMLPKLDGFRISRMLKFDETYRHIPIIMLTAKSDTKDKNIGKQTGADIYLTKPFDRKELINTIQNLVG